MSAMLLLLCNTALRNSKSVEDKVDHEHLRGCTVIMAEVEDRLVSGQCAGLLVVRGVVGSLFTQGQYLISWPC